MTDEKENEFKDEEFKDVPYDEISYREDGRIGNIIKGDSAKIEGKVKVSIQHDDLDDVKVILKKDEDDNIKEIKFVCSCGQTKTVILNYDE